MNREQRDALLLGDRNSASGGTPALPEAFRAVLMHLYENGTTNTKILHKIIREQDVVAFKDRRILEVWGTWEDFCAAILGVLSDGNFISVSLSDDGWDITPKATPGRELLILRIADRDGIDRRVRVTFHSEKERQQRNDMQVIKNDIDTLLTKLNRMRSVHPVYERIAEQQVAASQLLREALNGREEPPEDEEGTPFRRRRQKLRPNMRRGGVVREWVFQYMQEHPKQLMTIQDIAVAYDDHDAENIRTGKFGPVNTATITARLRDLNRIGPGKVEFLKPPDVRYVSAMYVPEGEQ